MSFRFNRARHDERTPIGQRAGAHEAQDERDEYRHAMAGYLSWLAGKGFTQAQFDASGFVVDVTDSGIDNGTTAPNHFGLYVAGARPGTSRVVYSRLEGTANPGSTLQGCDGHGNLNTHIIAGFNKLVKIIVG